MSTDAGRVTLSLKRDDFCLTADIPLPSKGIIGIFGASGCGKTTLLRCIAGLESTACGTVQVAGQLWQDEKSFLPPWARPVGYVFQDARLFPHLTVAGNLDYGRRRSNAGLELLASRDIIELLGIDHLMDRRPAQLSGGERQRVSIARALLRSPSLVLMDEPLAALDETRKQDIMPFLDRLHEHLQIPMLYVSHSLDEITRMCDQLVVMEAGEVCGYGALQDMLVRTDLPLLGGRSASSVLEATITDYDHRYELSRVRFEGGEMEVSGKHGENGSPLRLRIMASDVSLARQRPDSSSILNILPAVVEDLDAGTAGYVIVTLRVGSATLLARITTKSADWLGLAIGMSVFAQIKGVAVRTGVS